MTIVLENNDFLTVLEKIKKEPQNRLNHFIDLSPFFKTLSANQITEQLDALFTNIMKDKNSWVGALFVPDFYKRDKTKDIYLDIDFFIRESLVWAILYGAQVNDYFSVINNRIVNTKTPKQSLFEKEYKLIEKTVANGEKQYIKTKINNEQKYSNGFTGAQINAFFQYLVVGKFEGPKLNIKENLKNQEKESNKKKIIIKKRKI